MVTRRKYSLTKAPSLSPEGATWDRYSFNWTHCLCQLELELKLELELAVACGSAAPLSPLEYNTSFLGV